MPGLAAFYYAQMDISHAASLKEGARVVVPMGSIVADLYGTPPIVTTATVVGLDEDGMCWLQVDIAQNQQLPQRYRVEEIVGFLMPMAIVTSSPDGQTTYGTLPSDYVGP